MTNLSADDGFYLRKIKHTNEFTLNLITLLRKNHMKKLMLTLLFCLTTSAASAETFNLIDDGTSTVDLNSDLTWLDTSFTKGLSFDQVSSLISETGTLNGWRFATITDFTQVFESRGFAVSGATSQSQSTGPLPNKAFFTSFIDLLGVVTTNGSGSQKNIFGILADDYAVTRQYMGQINTLQTNSSSSVSFAAYQMGELDNKPNPGIASFLVRNISAVPEASPISYLLIGLCLFGFRLRSQSRVSNLDLA